MNPTLFSDLAEVEGLAGSGQSRKILFVSHSCLSYGAERSLEALVIALDSSSMFQPTVLLPCKNGYLYKTLTDQGIPVIVYPYFDWISSKRKYVFGIAGFLVNYLGARLLANKLKCDGFELVYSNSLATQFGTLLAMKLNRPHIWHIREFICEDLDKKFAPGIRYVKEIVEKSTAHIIYNSKAVSNKFSKLFSGVDSSVIYNGFSFGDYESFTDRYAKRVGNKSDIGLVIVGNVRYEKGQHYVIRCVHELRNRGLKVFLKIVGKGKSEYIGKLKKECGTLGVSEYVEFVGGVDNPLKYFEEAAVSIVASSNEAFGRVVVESCSVGCPVVVSDSGGLMEIIRHGETGLVFESGNVAQMANCVEQLINDRSAYNKISLNSAEEVREKFNLSEYEKGISFVIEDVLRRFVSTDMVGCC
ncbi:MAG: glycosyltransferase family 4 protein [Chromatiales bacterium]|jgi:glycosyltransferase involved in cell wall biosynthesis